MTSAQLAALEVAITEHARLLGAHTPLQRTILQGLAAEAIRIASTDLQLPPRRRSGFHPPIKTVPGFPPPSPGDWANMPTPTRKYGSG
jgi:hypothetical protein